MPTKRLPHSADITHLKYQAKDLLAGFRAGSLSAYQRIREFHPKCHTLPDADIAGRTFALSDAQLTIAREYGFASWPRLRAVLAEGSDTLRPLIHNDRIKDAVFRAALTCLDEGRAGDLSQHLRDHPDLVQTRVRFEGDNYFTHPTLLEFVAENPVRQDNLPGNIVEIAEIILRAGAQEDHAAVEATLGLVASGRVAREQGAQGPLIDLLCDYGADPSGALGAALAHGEFDAARALIARGAVVDLPAAAALGAGEEIAGLLAGASAEQRQLALSLAALHGRSALIQPLLQAGADPNRYNPEDTHSHCTPLHVAALGGHIDTVRALLDGGARCDIPDIHHNATAAGWAEHAGHAEIAALLRG